MTSLFGRRAFRGTGRTDDYYPEPPDLDFLQRPTFMAPSGGYNPKLDSQSLIAAGFSPRNAMVLQGLRQDLHQQAAAEQEYADSRRALQGLSKLDPSGRNFSKELLNIFRSAPGAMRNPEVLQQADFISKFAGKPQWSVEDIEDPDIYQQAVQEGWGNLSPEEARRRANAALTQRTIRGDLAALGMGREDLDKVKSWTQEDYLREKGRLIRESKQKPTEPWTQRLSDKERAAVREEVQAAMSPEDFETEFNAVLADNPGLTKDAYVKQFKGDPDYATYQQRRALESGVPQRLIREYGLTPQEAGSLLGVSITPETVTEDAFARSQSFAPGTPQNAPQSAPVPNAAVPAVQPQTTPTPAPMPIPQASGYSAIPSYKNRLESTPIDSIIKGVKQAVPVIGNLASNLTTDPLGKISDIALGRGSEVIGEATMTPSQERDNAKWNTAKTSMMEYLNSLGKSPQEVEEMLGSILRGDRLPIAVFLKEGATKDDEGRLTASTALGQAFRRANKTAAGSALTDSKGSYGWENVARALAQEYFTQKGVISPTNQSASPAPTKTPNIKSITKVN